MPRNLYDNANSVPLWTNTTIKLSPTQAHANVFFANTTANAFIQNETIGKILICNYDTSNN